MNSDNNKSGQIKTLLTAINKDLVSLIDLLDRADGGCDLSGTDSDGSIISLSAKSLDKGKSMLIIDIASRDSNLHIEETATDSYHIKKLGLEKYIKA